jgi:hypothetical protein
MTVLVGITGRAGCGKDTAVSIIEQIYPAKTVVQLSFTKKLKESTAALLGISVEKLEDLKRYYDKPLITVRDKDGTILTEHTFRSILQVNGTEAHRDIFGEDFWVEQAEKEIKTCSDMSVDIIVFPDVRYANEAQLIQKYGGIIISISSDNHEIGIDHGTEVPIPDELVDAAIHNGNFDDNMATLTSDIRDALKLLEWNSGVSLQGSFVP